MLDRAFRRNLWPRLPAFSAALACAISIGSAQERWPAGSPVKPSDVAVLPFPFLESRVPRPKLTSRVNSRDEGEREEDEIETDRDSFTPATRLAGRGRFIVESAYSFVDNRAVKETHSLPELLVRYGWTNRLEFRLGWNYEVGGAGSEVSGTDVGADDALDMGGLERETHLTYGLKLAVTNPEGWVPRSAVIIQGHTPTSGTATESQFVGTYVVGWELPRRWSFNAAMRYGAGSADEDHFNTWTPSAVLRVPLGEKCNLHAEYFGLFSSGKGQDFVRHFVSPGVHYLITANFEVGIRLGWGLNDQSSRFFTNVGMGWRF